MIKKIRKILSIITVVTIFLLISISPVLAEELSGFTDEGTGTATQSTDESAETVDNNILNVIVPTTEETTDASEESAGAEGQSTDESTESVDNDVLNVVIPIAEENNMDIVEDSTTTNEAVQPEEEDSEYLDSDVLNVIVPITVSVTIDPLELAGKGQIYSNTYKIKNYGETDVLLTFTDIQVTFADDINFEALAHPFNERPGSKLKSIFMMLDFGRDDVPPAIITDPNQKKEISIPLSAAQDDVAEDSLVQFNFSGNVNEASAQHWLDNDVKISLSYTLEMVQPPAEEITPPAIEEMLLEDETTLPEDDEMPLEEEATMPEEEVIPSEDTTPSEEATTSPEEEATSNAETENASVPDSADVPSESEAAESSPETTSSEANSPEPSESPEPSPAPSDTSE